jgi:ATP-dependent DNA ligase
MRAILSFVDLTLTPWHPMLARLDSALPQGNRWAYEPKWDGFRGLLCRTGGTVTLGSRNGRPLHDHFPALVAAALEALPHDCTLDGEILALSEGRPDFLTLL